MNLRRLGAWALIFSGLLMYVLVFEKPALEPEQQAPPGDYEKAFDLAQSDIAALSITYAGTSVTLRVKDLKWQVTDPPGAQALPEQCESMVAAVADTVLLSVIEEQPADLAQYGLKDPLITLALQADDGGQRTLKLGKKSPSGVSLYGLDVERNRVVLVGTYISFSAKMFMDNIKGLPAQ